MFRALSIQATPGRWFVVALVTAIMTTATTGAAYGANAVKVVVGRRHTCVLTNGGAVKCWGDNTLLQLGDGTEVGRSMPADVDGLTSGVKAIAAGDWHTCAITSSGGVKCWGYNNGGTLGDGGATRPLTPVDVLGLTSGVIAIAAGDGHTCAVTAAGGVKCWGRNDFGQVGDGTPTASSRPTPVEVSGLTSGVAAIAAGGFTTCALTAAGGVKCWGSIFANVAHATPIDIDGLTSGVSSVSVGGSHACAVASGGRLKCWGFNGYGELGDGTTASRAVPGDVSGLENGIVGVAAGTYHTCAITTSGAAKCWGFNYAGQLGDGTTTTRLTPAGVNGATTRFAAIAAGDSHTCAVTRSGAVKCWGSNNAGQLGLGERSVPNDVLGLTSGMAAVVAGGSFTCALTTGGGVKCWGDNSSGQLGDGTTTTRAFPGDVTGLSRGVFAIAAGRLHACAITSGGGVRCWGDNTYGQLGDGSTASRAAPADVIGLTSGVVAIGAGDTHTCAVTASGGVKCWGDNSYGQLGDGTTTNRAAPADVIGLATGVTAVAGGNFHTCAVTSSGGLKCWGYNGYGDLGDGTRTSRFSPVEVSGLQTGVIAVSADGYVTCAVTTSGGVKCWGSNIDGKLGNGRSTDYVFNNDSAVPVDVFGLPSGAVAVTAGGVHTCAVTAAGGVKCWGDTNGYVYTPVDVGGITGMAVAAAAGAGHTCALTSDGAVKCWGGDASGQLGDGMWVPPLSMVTVPGFGIATDFNGDGRPDIVLRDVAADATIFWLMNGSQVGSQDRQAGPTDRNWQLAALADFNQDGNADLLWRNAATGEIEIWHMDGTARVDSVALDTVPDLHWQIAAAADFNGDGKPDIVWRNIATGENVVRYMDASTRMVDESVKTWADVNWTIAAADDFNGDGKPDLLWRNRVTGENIVWFLNRAAYVASATLDTVSDTHWTVVGTGDFNGDGNADIVWSNVTTGETSIWFMTGTTHAGTASLPAVPVLVSKRPRGNGPTIGLAVPRAGASLSQPLATRLSAGSERAPHETAPAPAPSPDSIVRRIGDDGNAAAPADRAGAPGDGVLWRTPTVCEHVWFEIRASDAGHAASPEPGDPTWEMLTVADFDGDGEADAIWRDRTTGENVIWFARDGEHPVYAVLPPVADENWQIVAAADYDGDGQLDLLWRNQVTGESIVWLMKAW